MPSLSDDFQMPIMYQDLRNPSMGAMPAPYFGMYTNYLGGITLPREPQNDQFVYKERSAREKNTLKKAAIIFAGITGVVFLKQKGAFKWVSTQWTKGMNWLKNLFKPKPPAP